MRHVEAVVLLLVDSELQELCSDTLARMIHMASSVRYEVLELMNRKILEKKAGALRGSLLSLS